MGRIGEVITRTWQTADKMKRQRGPLPGEKTGTDNVCVRRYVAKFTINPRSLTASHTKSARWKRENSRISRCGSPLFWRQARDDRQGRDDRVVGDGRRKRIDPHAGARDLPADVRQLWRRVAFDIAHIFITDRHECGIARETRPEKKAVAVNRCRGLTKRDMVNNDALPPHRGRSGHLRSARGRRAADMRARASLADGAALFSILGVDLFTLS